MLRHFITLLILVFAIQFSYAQGKFSPTNADLSFPRSIVDAQEIPAVRARLNESPTNLTLYELIWDKASEVIPVGNTELLDRRNRSEIAREAAFVFLMQRKVVGNDLVPLTSADSVMMLNKVITLLDSVNTDIAVLPDWNFYFEWQFRSPELMHFLIAYDLLKGANVSDSLLTTAENNLKEFAGTLYIRTNDFYPFPGIPFWSLEFYSYNPNNHGVMNSSALGLAGIVLGDLEDADPNYQPINWINAGMWNLDNTLFNADGVIPRVSEYGTIAGYAESPGYFRYGFKNAFPFIRAMWNFLPEGNMDFTYHKYTYPITSISQPEILTRSIPNPWYDENYYNIYSWMNKIRMPNGGLPSVHDTRFNIGTSMTALSGQSQFNIPNPNYLPRPVWERSQFLSTLVDEGEYTDSLFQALPDAGSLIFRSAYSNPSATYMHLIGKNGIALAGAKAHHQADATSFQLYFNNEMMALDAGYPTSPYRLNAAQASDHNLILVNGEGPGLPNGEIVSMDNEVFIENFFDASSMDYGELRGGWQGADITRKTMFLHNSFYVITDFVTSGNVNDYQFQLHGHGLINADPSSDEGAYTLDTANNKVTYSRNNTHLVSYLTARNDASSYSYASDSLSIGVNLYREHSKTLVHKNDVTDTEFLSVLFPYKDSDEPILQEIASDNPDASAAFIEDANFKNIVLTQPTNNNTAITESLFPVDVQANGNINLFSTTSTDEFKMVFMENGDSLFYENSMLIAADKKLDILYEQSGELVFEGYVSDEATIQFYSEFPLEPILGNIANASFDQNTETATIVFSSATNFKLQMDTIMSLSNEIIKEENISIEIFPNPFDNQANIVLNLEKPEQVNLSIYDSTGKLISKILDQNKLPAGSHSFTFDSMKLNSGLYHAIVHTSDKTIIKKMILIE